MGLDVWFREDIASALMAAEQASATTVAAIGNDVANPVAVRAYRQGFQAALATVAIAFGIESLTEGPTGYDKTEHSGHGRRGSVRCGEAHR